MVWPLHYRILFQEEQNLRKHRQFTGVKLKIVLCEGLTRMMVSSFSKAWKYSISALQAFILPCSTSFCMQQDIDLDPCPPVSFTTWWAVQRLFKVDVRLQAWSFSIPVQNSCNCLLKGKIRMMFHLLLISSIDMQRVPRCWNTKNLKLRDLAGS